MPDTGNTATIVFGTSAFAAKYQEIGASEQDRGKIKDSHLGSTPNETYQPGDLIDVGEVDCEFQWTPGAMPPFAAPETVTITYPVPFGGASGATLSGSAFIRKRKTAPMKNGELMVGGYTLCWTGKTGPTFTPGT